MCIATPSAAIASPAIEEPGRPYEGPRGIEGDDPLPPVPDAPPPLLLPARADDDEVEVDDEPIDDDVRPAPFDWRDTPEGETASRRIRGGVILTGGGALLVFGAAILGTTDPCRRLAGNGCQRGARTRAALTMGIPGAFVLAAGATLLGLGIAQRKRARASVLVDVAGRHGGGLSIVGRF